MSRSRAWVVGVLAAAAVCVLAATIVLVTGKAGSGASATAAATSLPMPSLSPSSVTAPPEVRWIELDGVSLPVSATDGPQDLSEGLARGFADSPTGAALAAVHLVIRTSPSVSPAIVDSTLLGQVVGPNQPALVRSVAKARTATTAPTATVAGYVPISFQPARAASVDLVIGSLELALRRQYLSVRVSLEWSDDDWRLVAPPQGDWSTVTSTIDALPVGMHRYGA